MIKTKWILILGFLLASQNAFAKGKIQNEDVKSLSELTGAGGSASQLINDTKIYVTANSINQQLSSAISGGLLGGGSGGVGINILANPGFETGITSGYTNSGGTFTSVSSGSNLLIGQKSATFTASGAGQYMTSSQYAIPNGLKGSSCLGQIMYKGGDANLTLQVWNGTSVIASQVLAPLTYPTNVGVTFICPSSGTIGIRVISTGSAALVALDQFYLGQNIVNQVSQANYVGGAFVPPGCLLENSATTNYADFAVSSTSCAGYTLLGAASTAGLSGGQNGQINFASLPPGEYLATWTGTCGHAVGGTDSILFAITDGVTYGPNYTISHSTSETVSLPCTMQAHFTYTATGSHLFKIQAFQGAGGDTAQFYQNGNQSGEVFSLYRFPTQSELVVSPSTYNWVVDAFSYSPAINIQLPNSGSGDVILTDSTNVLNVITTTSNTASGVQQPCVGFSSNGLSCPGGQTPQVGIVFNLPSAQQVQVCVSGAVALGGTTLAVGYGWDIIETPNNADTVLQSANLALFTGLQGSPQSEVQNFAGCGVMTFTTGGQKTLKLDLSYGVSGTVTSNLLLTDRSQNRALRWSIRPVTQNVPAPVIIGSVYGNPQYSSKILGITGSCAASPSFLAVTDPASGPSLVHNATGDCTLNLASGYFQSTPVCTMTIGPSGTVNGTVFMNTVSATAIRFLEYANGTANDDAFSILCYANNTN